MKTKTIILTLIILNCIFIVRAQDSFQEDVNIRPFQFTFLFPPLSTNGANCSNTVSNFSLNPLVGYTGGTDGCELAGLINMNRHFVKGLQISGFGNFVNGRTDGCQIAGFSNINGDNVIGVHIAGFANIVSDTASGFQCAGFTNVNRVGNDLVGIAGFANISPDGLSETQVAGFVNVADGVDGVQIAGFANIARDVKGIQVSGFVNVNDTITGIPIGIINISKTNGYRKWEVSADEVCYLNVSFKLGIPWFYNVFTLSKPAGDPGRILYGGGLGSEDEWGEKWLFNFEASVHQELWINDNNAPRFLYTDRLNMISRIRASFGYRVDDRLTVFIGPSLNVRTATLAPYHLGIGDDLEPYWGDNNQHYYRNTKVSIWPGFNAGIVF